MNLSDDAQEVEDEMLAAIASLPPDLRARAEELPFPQLHNACAYCDLELIAALLGAGLAADMYPCTEDDDDEPPLVWIAKHYEGALGPAKAAIDLLLRSGADIDEGYPVLAAAEYGNGGLVDIFVVAGADIVEALKERPSAQAKALILKAQLAATTPKATGGPVGNV